jgi:hypothetical protein
MAQQVGNELWNSFVLSCHKNTQATPVHKWNLLNTAPLLSHLNADRYIPIWLLPANVGTDSTSNMCQMWSYVQIRVSAISFPANTLRQIFSYWILQWNTIRLLGLMRVTSSQTRPTTPLPPYIFVTTGCHASRFSPVLFQRNVLLRWRTHLHQLQCLR